MNDECECNKGLLMGALIAVAVMIIAFGILLFIN